MHQLKWEWYLCTRRLSHYAPVNPAWKSLTAYLMHSGVNDYITLPRFRPLCGLTQYARQPSNCIKTYFQQVEEIKPVVILRFLRY